MISLCWYIATQVWDVDPEIRCTHKFVATSHHKQKVKFSTAYFKFHFYSFTNFSLKCSGHLCYYLNTTQQQALADLEHCLQPLNTTINMKQQQYNQCTKTQTLFFPLCSLEKCALHIHGVNPMVMIVLGISLQSMSHCFSRLDHQRPPSADPVEALPLGEGDCPRD